ncbi:MAG TPA: 16S rRNA (adenine(1518)-N(6)/adenine(1519)-N(6))-dimethyltransferase RsmA [Dehalococcoidia bacterium]|nr:16S rRNA (adenine(1518)-N(6)/adenine(1519)-N(6))-dimethyltransferase RsmA [Dehalococcoidia bacterium]
MSTSSSSSRGRRAKKRFGQHFLFDANILRRIVDAAELLPGETVLEVGPGRGALTAEIARRGHRVVAVEIDRDLTGELRARFAGEPNVAIVEGDVLAFAPEDLLRQGGAAPPYAVVANLPYNIAAAVLRRLLEAGVPPRRIVAMVQREVAEAIVAGPGGMSLLSVAVQAYGEARIVLRVPPGAFSPPPKVQSAVVRIDVAPAARVSVPLDRFFSIVRAGFGNTRKQLRNSLAIGLAIPPAAAEEMLKRAGIDPARRAQTLTVEEWERVTRASMEQSAS